MLHITKTVKRIALGFLLALLLSALIRSVKVPFLTSTMLQGFFYCGITIAWMISILIRINERKVRSLLVAIAALVLLFFYFKIVRYNLIPDFGRAHRFFWYAYYIPFIGIPLCSILIAARIGMKDDQKLHSRWYALYLVGLLLILTFLGNDVHELCFRFQGNPDYERYSYGPVYYLSVVWVFILTACSFIILYRKCTLSQVKKKVYYPISVLVLELLYMFIVFLYKGQTPDLPIIGYFRISEVYSICNIAFWEANIQIGLISANSEYSGIFKMSRIRTILVDENGDIVLKSASAKCPSKEQLLMAREDACYIAPDMRLQSHKVKGGWIYWVSDLSGLHRISQQYREAAEQLAESNTLLSAENELKENKLRNEWKNQLYDEISLIAKPYFTRIRAELFQQDLSDRAFRRQASVACVASAYIKRRANLMFLKEQTGLIDARELLLSIRESMEYLQFLDISTHVTMLLKTSVCTYSADTILLLYDYFESFIEERTGLLEALMVRLAAENALTFKLIASLAKGTKDHGTTGYVGLSSAELAGRLIASGGKKTEVLEDDTLYITLTTPQGGSDNA